MKKIYKMLWLLALLAVMPVANVVAQNVAKIGDKEYATLEEAVAAATTGQTITLLADVDLSSHARSASDDIILEGVTLDLNGKTIRGFNNGVRYSGNNAVIKNGTFDFVAAEQKPNYGLSIGSYTDGATVSDNMVLEDLTVVGGINIDLANVTLNNVNINMNQSKFYAIWVDEDGSNATFNSGTINAGSDATAVFGVAKTNASLKIAGGTINTNGEKFRLEGGYMPVEVSGGVFDTQVPEDCCAAGFIPQDNGNGTYGVKEGSFVAQIGTTKYETLADAVAAVPAGTETTITVIADQIINVEGYAITIPATKNVVLDLNGFQVVGTVEQEGTSALIRNLGTLTIMDSSDTEKDGTGTGKLMSGADPTWTWDGTDDYTGSYASNLIRNEKDLTVESGLLYNMSTGSASYAIDNYSAGNVTINGGKVDAAKASAIRLFYIDGGSITVTDGVIGHYTSDTDRSFMGVQVMSGTNANVSIKGGTLAGKNAFYASNSGGTMSITGGTFNGAVGSSNITGFISNGTFSEPVNPSLCASGKKCVEDGDEYIIVDDSDPREPAGEFVYYYWYNSNNEEEGETCAFSTPFTSNWLCDGEFITLLNDITLTEDIACQLASGSFTLTQGTHSITKGNYSVTLLPGVSVVTDKQTDIFTAPTTITETVNNGVYTYTAAPSDAKIGNTYYATLAEAVAAAQNGETVTLLADVTLTDRLFVNAGATPAYAGTGNRYATTAENKSITLDMNGHNITSNSNSNIALAGGSLNITNTGTADATHGVISTSNDGLAPVEVRGTGELTQKRTLTVGTGVTLTGSTYGLNVFGSNNAQKNIIDVNVNGTVNGTLFVLGNLTNAENEININVNGTIYVPNNDNNSAEVGIALNGNATVTVNEGANVSGETGIEVRAGELVVNGGTITATASTYSYTANNSGSSTKGAAIAVAQHSTVLPITTTLNGGTLTGGEKSLVVEAAQNNELKDVVVTATTSYTQQAEIPEGYKWKATGENTYTLVEDIYVLTDGIAYTNDEEDITNAKVAYKRTFGNDRVNKYQAWMVPFGYKLTATDVENFDFYEINKIEYAEQGNTTKMQIRLSSAKAADDILEANMPYVFMPKSAVGEYTFKAEGVILTAADGTSVRKTFKVAEGVNVVFSSVYQNTKPTDENYIYYASINGKVGYANNADVTNGFAGVGPFRWIFKISGVSSSTAFTFGFAADEDDDVTAVSSAAADSAESEVVGYYTLSGQKVSEPTKGVYVVKYANGTSKKVVF